MRNKDDKMRLQHSNNLLNELVVIKFIKNLASENNHLFLIVS
jgi:hypothetical protein